MLAHAKSYALIQYFEAEVLAARAGSILRQLQSVTEEQRIKKKKQTGRVLRDFCDVLTSLHIMKFPTPQILLLLLI